MTELAVDAVKYREDLYPRIKHDPALVQRYAADLEPLPPIEVNQHHELIDGWHRWTAHKKAEAESINVVVTETASDVDFLRLAIKRNAAHGLQLDERSKKSMAIRLYHGGTGATKEDIADTLSVSLRMVQLYLSDTDKGLQEEQDRVIFDLWQRCYTQDEISDAVNLPRKTVADKIATFGEKRSASQSAKSADFAVEIAAGNFTPPIYNIWRFSKSSNNVAHFGNSEQTIVDNLLYLYTEPNDIVVDPFAGGGSTLDVCRKRGRRCWIADRKPIVEREKEIRLHDCIAGGAPALNRMWSDVALTYLDPPYWRQAVGQYSDDAADLGNYESADEFHKDIAGLIKGIARKQSKGVIALIIQPTQWNAPGRQFTDHVYEIIRQVGNGRLTVENRVSCPYNSEQYNAQMVNYAKEHKQLLVLTRELIIWRVNG